MTDIDRIDKLFAPVIVTFTWAYVVGIYAHEYVKQIETKKTWTKGEKSIQIWIGDYCKHFAKFQMLTRNRYIQFFCHVF
ncbi:hypothetical protein FACS189416_5310 [Bacteroidia bacterium]|nr:hypothetical protein FACS189416_5310 [Bacteroidia bacterium]